MQTYDLFMVAVLVLTTVAGAYKGMAWQIASLASLVVSYLVALKFREPLAPYFGNQAPWNAFVAMLVLYVVTSFVIWMAFRMVAGMIDRVKLREFDHQLGGLLGLAKGVLLCTAITFFAVTLSENMRVKVLNSRSGYYIAQLMDRAHGVMPNELHELLDPYIHQLDEKLDPAGTHHGNPSDPHRDGGAPIWPSAGSPAGGQGGQGSTLLDRADAVVRSGVNRLRETAQDGFDGLNDETRRLRQEADALHERFEREGAKLQGQVEETRERFEDEVSRVPQPARQ